MTHNTSISESGFIPMHKSASYGKKISRRFSDYLPSGTVLCNGKYVIRDIIGHGGFGITYKAERTSDGTSVAIKELFLPRYCYHDEMGNVQVMDTDAAHDVFASAMEMFHTEPLNIMNCRHRNILRAYFCFKENKTLYYVMEYIQGYTLEEELRKSKGIPADQAVRVITDIAGAVDYMHRCHMVHLDIKPANIMIRRGGDAVLIDFGSSKRLFSRNKSPLILTRGYYSDDMFDYPSESRIDYVRFDVYALGITLYRLITNRFPNMPENRAACVPSALKEIIDRATDLSDNGYSDVSQFISALYSYADNKNRIHSYLSYDTCA